jgi:excinuclease ABC subunit C
MVVFEDGAPATREYRRFRIKTVEGQDDFASMREVLTRRFARIAEQRRRAAEASERRAMEQAIGEEPAGAAAAEEADADLDTDVDAALDAGIEEGAPPSSWDAVPGLVVIDGGKGQLGAALDVMRNYGLGDIPICGLAKREEEVFMQDVDEPIILPRDSQALYLLQRVRDEAHRFAITYHRTLRGKAVRGSVLDTIPGIGPKRKRALLKKFGSVRALQEASVDEIASTVGFTRRLAETVKRSL